MYFSFTLTIILLWFLRWFNDVPQVECQIFVSGLRKELLRHWAQCYYYYYNPILPTIFLCLKKQHQKFVCNIGRNSNDKTGPCAQEPSYVIHHCSHRAVFCIILILTRLFIVNNEMYTLVGLSEC